MKKKLKVMLGLAHLALPLALFGCSSSGDSNSDSNDESENSDSSSSQFEEDDDESSSEAIESSADSDEEENKLAGTCPKGRYCSAPGMCHLFTDSNNNDLCDRGE
jgi:hypothetical protein